MKIFLEKVNHFQNNLRLVIETYNREMQLIHSIQNLNETFMSVEDYEQSMLKAIYYIKRYEYEAMIQELNNLRMNSSDNDK